jgi:hypothetical protein
MKLTEDGLKDGVTQLPRLEALARKLGLDEFEKGVVVMLTAVSISPVVKSIFEAENGDGSYRRSSEAVQVKDILIVYFDSFKEQVLNLVISPVSMIVKFDVDSDVCLEGLVDFKVFLMVLTNPDED